MVFPVVIVDVTGTTKFGCCGVLLAVGAPCNNSNVPVGATFLKGKTKLRLAALLAVFTAFRQNKSAIRSSDRWL